MKKDNLDLDASMAGDEYEVGFGVGNAKMLLIDFRQKETKTED